tara:strand:+ start:1563 stop:2486 length:924 start_codon:yes stop_codon:yes gene_type:complete
MSHIYNRVALIGLGLIASSMAHAMRRGNLAGQIVGHSRSIDTQKKAISLEIFDEVFGSAKEAVENADLVVLCVPVGAMGSVAKDISAYMKAGSTLTDVGSTKRAVIDSVSPHVREDVFFVPAHPVAGTEQSGPDAGFAELFDNRWCLMTPGKVEDHNLNRIEKLKLLWTSIGANVELMDPDHHDLVLAVTSHAPHLIAYTMVGVADDLRRVTDSEVVKYSAAGFRDFTRIAASDPTMWRDVFLSNKDATLEILGRFTEELFALQRAIRTGDGDYLHEYFTRTRELRRGVVEAGQDTDAPDFGRFKGR